MGIKDKNGNLRGKVGNLTYRVSGNLNVVQSRPERGQTNMSAASMMGSYEFALASNRAKILRLVVRPLLRGMYDGRMINRLTSAVLNTIKSNVDLLPGERDLPDAPLQKLAGFEFNLNSPFQDALRENVQVNAAADGLHLHLAAFNPQKKLSFPASAIYCKLSVLLSVVDLKNFRYSHCEVKTLVIMEGATGQPEINWHFNRNFAGDVLVVLTASLEYAANGLMEKFILNSPQVNPVTLLGIYQLPHLPDAAVPPETVHIWGNWFPIPGMDASQSTPKP